MPLRPVLRTLLAGLGAVLSLAAAPVHAQQWPVSSAEPAASSPRAADAAPLILISIDGFRPDYLKRGLTPVLSRLATEGVSTPAMRPAFPSLTFPNHYTLVTGVSPDRHGIVGNIFNDPAIPGVRFNYKDFDAASDPRWWNGARPIWVGAKAQGLRTATLYWPGSEAAIAGPEPGAKPLRPDRWAHFDDATAPARRVDLALDWLALPAEKRPQLITLYFDQVDHAGHDKGPDSAAVNAAVAEVDAAIGRLQAGLRARGIAANLVIVSDHGMTAASLDRVLFLDDWIDRDQATALPGGPLIGLSLKNEALAPQLLAKHAHATCWRKDQIPARLHYGANPRVSPYLCLADPGWVITTRKDFANRKAFSLGQHGYDNAAPEMAALFIASGPAFRPRVRLPAFDNVNVYPLLAQLLGIRPDPNEGSLATWTPALR